VARDRLAIRSAPYVHVFPAAAAVVHPGGFGTCAEALRAGKPSLVTPFAFDQFDTAARVQDAGLGLWFRRNATNADGIASALERVLGNDTLAAAARGAGAAIAAAENGADRAAARIEALGRAST
jgi:UDP:flavonoid glycosyltransferase YjiC (YdhE family)